MIEAFSSEILKIPWVGEVKRTYETAITAEEDAYISIADRWHGYRNEVVRSTFSRLMSRLDSYLPSVIPANPKLLPGDESKPTKAIYYIPSTNEFLDYQKEQVDVLGRIILLDEEGQYDPESPNFRGVDFLHQPNNTKAIRLRPVNPVEGFINIPEEWELDRDIYNAVREIEKILRARRRGPLPGEGIINPYLRFNRLIDRRLLRSKVDIEQDIEEERRKQSISLAENADSLTSTILRVPLIRTFAPSVVSAGRAEGGDLYYLYILSKRRLVVGHLRESPALGKELFRMGFGDWDIIEEVKPPDWFKVTHRDEISPQISHPRFYQPLLDSLVTNLLHWPLSDIVRQNAEHLRQLPYS